MERNPAFIEVVYAFADVTITCADSTIWITPRVSFIPPTAACTSTPATKVVLTGPITNQATGQEVTEALVLKSVIDDENLGI